VQAQPPDPSHQTQASESSAQPALHVQVHSGLLLTLQKFVLLVGVIVASTFIVLFGLRLWRENQSELVAKLQQAGVQPDEALPALPTWGDEDAPLTLLLSCDLGQPLCRKQLKWLKNWVDKPDGQPPASKLIFLYKVPRGGDFTGAVAMQVAAGQTWWQIAATLGQDDRRLPPEEIALQAQLAMGKDIVAYQQAAEREETQLYAALGATMARGLGIPEDVSVLAAGLPLMPDDVASEPALRAALAGRAAQFAQALAQAAGDARVAQVNFLQRLPRSTRERYVCWILDGHRCPHHGHLADAADFHDPPVLLAVPLTPVDAPGPISQVDLPFIATP